MNTSDYKELFEQSLALVVVMDTDFTIVAASDEYLKATKTKRENIIGRNIFHVFPDNPDDLAANGESKIRASFNRVLKNKTVDTLAVVKYNIPKPESEGAGFVLKYWKPCHSPVLDEFNNVKYIIQRVDDVTENEALAMQLEVEKKALEKIEDSEKRYNMLLLKSPFAFALFKGKDMVITLANDSIKKIWGKGQDLEGRPLFAVLPELKDTPFPGLLDNVYTTGIPFYGDEVLAQVQRKDKLEDGYFNFIYQPYLEADETISGVTVIAYEVTANVLVKKALEEKREAEKKALKKIEESNKRYHMMLMESPFAFSVMKGKEMVVTIANDLMKAFWGKGKDVEGKTLLQVLPELIDQPFPELINKVYTTGIPVYVNEILAQLKHNGKLEDRYFNIVYQPHHEADDTISGVTTIAYEVTELVLARKKVEESENRFQGAVAAVQGILWTNNAKGEMEGEQQGWASLTGQSYKEYQGFGWTKAVHPDDVQSTIEAWNEAVLKQKNFVFEHRLQTKKGNWGRFSIRAIPLMNPDGLIKEWVGVHTDITKQREAEEEVKESVNRYKSLTKATTSVVWITDVKGDFLEPQPSWQEYTGQPWEEHKGLGWTNMIQEDDRQKIIQLWQAALEQKSNFHTSGRIWSKKHQAYRYFESTGIPRFDFQKNIKEWVGMIADVHEQKTASAKIEESEHRYREIIYSSPFMIAVFKGEHMIIDIANDAILESWGKGKDIFGKSIFSVMPEIIEQGFDKLLLSVYKTGTPVHAYETPTSLVRHGKLELLHYTFVYQPQRNINGEIEGVTVIANETTSQALLNKKIKVNEERFRLLVQQAPVAICVLRGEDYIIETINERMVEMWGRKMEEVLNKPAFDVLTELRDQGFKELLDNVYNTGERFVAQELPINLQRKGKLESAFVKFVYEPFREANGMITGVMALAHEITDQVLARKRIEESETKFRLLSNAMPQKIINADAAGNLIFFNQQWLDDTGYSMKELKGWGWGKAMHPDDLERTIKNWKHSVSTGNVFDMECRIQNKEGEYKWHLGRAVPIKDETGKITMWVGSYTDIHVQKEQKDELEKAVSHRTKQLRQKNVELENVNKDLTSFTYVSSHDLQEPLRKIQNFATVLLLEEEKNLSETGKGYFQRMVQTAQRMQALIEDLLMYSRTKSGDRIFENIDLNLLLNEVKMDFEEVIRQKKAIIKVTNLGMVRIIPFQFHQLLQNLISNSLKFSKTKVLPRIIIKSETVTGNQLHNEKLLPQKKYCHITFTDNGIGFDPQYKDRIFEVFQRLHSLDEYTGTGIGLAICKRIIENHNGIITATGKLKKGAQFDIYIPAD